MVGTRVLIGYFFIYYFIVIQYHRYLNRITKHVHLCYLIIFTTHESVIQSNLTNTVLQYQVLPCIYRKSIIIFVDC